MKDEKTFLATKKIFIITGPSGAGKGSVINKITDRYKYFTLPDSFTTRPKRVIEGTRKKYIFIDTKTFKNYVKQNKMLEYEQEHLWWYGTSKESFDLALKSDKQLILELEPRGALTIKKIYPSQAVIIFINPGSIEELKMRILADPRRNNIDPKELDTRSNFARKELKYAKKCDYVVDNKNNYLDEAVNEVIQIIQNEIGIKLE